MFYFLQFLSYGIPAAAVVFFAVSLVRYLRARSANKREAGQYSEREMGVRRLMLIISSVVAGVMLATIVATIGLLFTAIAFM